MALISAGLTAGGTILGQMGGTDERRKTEAFPGQTQGIEELMNAAKTGMRQPGRTSGIDFSLNPSDIQQATEGSVLGKIKNPTDYSGYSKEVSADLYKTRKAQIDEQYAEEQKRQANMYNRLGLVSSTPFMQASQDLGRKQTTDINAVGAQQSYDDYNRQLEAKKFGDTLNLSHLNLGNVLGQADTGRQQYTKGAKYTDFARAEDQPLKWASILGQTLGSQQPYYPEESPSTTSQLGMAGQDIGSLLMLYSMLGKNPSGGGASAGGSGLSPTNWWGGSN